VRFYLFRVLGGFLPMIWLHSAVLSFEGVRFGHYALRNVDLHKRLKVRQLLQLGVHSKRLNQHALLVDLLILLLVPLIDPVWEDLLVV